MLLASQHFEERAHAFEEATAWTVSIRLSDTDYINLANDSKSSARQIIAMTSLIDLLRRTIGPRCTELQQVADLAKPYSLSGRAP